MRLHIITIGQPKLSYAQQGWQEYTKRLGRFHQLRITHLADKYADDSAQIRQAVGNAYLAVLEIRGKQMSSEALSRFLERRALDGRELCLVIGGPDGLPADIITGADSQWSLS